MIIIIIVNVGIVISCLHCIKFAEQNLVQKASYHSLIFILTNEYQFTEHQRNHGQGFKGMNLSFSFLMWAVTSVVIVLLTLTGLSETNTNSDSEPGNPNLMLLDCKKYH